MQRILLIGCGGAGKSTLARRLGELLGLEVIHLDKHYWQPGWVERPRDDWDKALERLLARDRWIMDGNYHRTIEMRMRRADTVVFLDVPRWRCIVRALRRVRQYHGNTRPDLPDGCPEKYDLGFMMWIWGYARRVRPEILEVLGRHKDTHRIEILRGSRAIEAFVASL